MRLSQLESIDRQLTYFVEEFSDIWNRKDRCLHCKEYVFGLLLDGDRKSIEPLASRIPNGNMQALQQFTADSPWDPTSLQLKLAEYMNHKLKPEAEASVLILDDTSLPKQGKSSIGVKRQYCGALGKIANCQVMVSWQYAEGGQRQIHFPLLAELFLPEDWTQTPERLVQAKVPERRFEFKEKWKIALDLLDQIRHQFPHEACIFDAGYGEIRPFLQELDSRNEFFVAQIPGSPAGFWPIDVPTRMTSPSGRGPKRKYPAVADPNIKLFTAEEWAQILLTKKKAWHTIRLPLQRRKKVKVAATRVRERLHADALRSAGPARWLICEQYVDGTLKYYVSNFPETASIRKMIHIIHSRYKIEQGYQQLKEEIGLDHYEGRSWLGLHHHISLCFMAFDFLVSLQNQDYKKKETKRAFKTCKAEFHCQKRDVESISSFA